MFLIRNNRSDRPFRMATKAMKSNECACPRNRNTISVVDSIIQFQWLDFRMRTIGTNAIIVDHFSPFDRITENAFGLGGFGFGERENNGIHFGGAVIEITGAVKT